MCELITKVYHDYGIKIQLGGARDDKTNHRYWNLHINFYISLCFLNTLHWPKRRFDSLGDHIALCGSFCYSGISFV